MSKDFAYRPRGYRLARRALLALILLVVCVGVLRGIGLGYSRGTIYAGGGMGPRGEPPDVRIRSTTRRSTFLGVFTLKALGGPYTLDVDLDLPGATITKAVFDGGTVSGARGDLRVIDRVELPLLSEGFHEVGVGGVLSAAGNASFVDPIAFESDDETLVARGSFTVTTSAETKVVRFERYFRRARQSGFDTGYGKLVRGERDSEWTMK